MQHDWRLGRRNASLVEADENRAPSTALMEINSLDTVV